MRQISSDAPKDPLYWADLKRIASSMGCACMPMMSPASARAVPAHFWAVEAEVSLGGSAWASALVWAGVVSVSSQAARGSPMAAIACHQQTCKLIDHHKRKAQHAGRTSRDLPATLTS